MMYRIKHIWVWLRRCMYCRGFGVQSPWAYRFIRYVINEHAPYYAYAELKRKLPDVDWKTRRLAQLYFRIANYRQPETVFDYLPSTSAYAAYFKAGCHSSVVTGSSSFDKASVYRISMVGGYQEIVEQVIVASNVHTILILEGIYQDHGTKVFWQQMVDDVRCVTTFDLYYCGIIFFDKKRYKDKYIVNY